MRAKVFCDVPGCRRFMFGRTCLKLWGTTDVRIMCGGHWRRLSKRERAVLLRFRRLRKRYGDEAVSDERIHRAWSAAFKRVASPERIGREVGL
jgi:hypothetical protein